VNFYNYFINLCGSSHTSPSRVALDVGLSKTAVNGWKNGRLPNDSSLYLLANYFFVPIETFWACDDIAEKRGVDAQETSSQPQESNYPQREQMRQEMRILFDAAEDAPTSAILEAAALLMRYKEQNK